MLVYINEKKTFRRLDGQQDMLSLHAIQLNQSTLYTLYRDPF